MEWARILAYITGTVDQELLLRNEYLAAENRILKAQLKGRLRLSDAERAKLGEIGHRLGRKAFVSAWGLGADRRKRGKSRGGQGGRERASTKSGRRGMGWLAGTASLAPR